MRTALVAATCLALVACREPRPTPADPPAPQPALTPSAPTPPPAPEPPPSPFRVGDRCPEPVPEPIESPCVTPRGQLHFGRVDFAFDKATIRPKSYFILDRLAAWIVSHQGVGRLRIEGHRNHNPNHRPMGRSITRNRARSVRKYLIHKGVSPKRLVAKGFGDNKPLVMPNHPDALRINRRIDLFVEAMEAGTLAVP